MNTPALYSEHLIDLVCKDGTTRTHNLVVIKFPNMPEKTKYFLKDFYGWSVDAHDLIEQAIQNLKEITEIGGNDLTKYH